MVLHKIYFILNIFFSSNFIPVNELNLYGEKNNDSIIRLTLPEFTFHECFDSLLNILDESQTVHNKFPQKLFYFELVYISKNGRKSLDIIPARFFKARNIDFVGAIKFKGRIYLCRGDFSADTLFKRGSKIININLVRPYKYYYDKIDEEIEMNAFHPSFAGTYTVCKNEIVDLYILVGPKIDLKK